MCSRVRFATNNGIPRAWRKSASWATLIVYMRTVAGDKLAASRLRRKLLDSIAISPSVTVTWTGCGLVLVAVGTYAPLFTYRVEERCS